MLSQIIMTSETEHDPGGSKSAPSYAAKLKTNVRWDQRLKRNILEISLEKSDRDTQIDQECIAKLFKALGIDIKNQVEGYYVKSNIISVRMPSGVALDRFCREQSFKVTDGVQTRFIRPAGKKDVAVTIRGLDWNTPDNFVIEYLNKFGVVISNSVIYTQYRDGPFMGKYNGERKYQCDFSKSKLAMGTFHLIDGARVHVFYPGNKRTCGRCHQTPENCVGEGFAKHCEDNNGTRVPLVDHMKNLWTAIGFEPREFELEIDEEGEDTDSVNDVPIRDSSKFSPKINRPEPTNEDIGKYNGISIKNFPRNLDKSTIVEFLNCLLYTSPSPRDS